MPLTAIQIFLFGASGALHRHHEDAILSPDLPAEYHHHHYQFRSGIEVGLDVDGCLGCRLERSPAAPMAGPTSFVRLPADSSPIPVSAVGLPRPSDDSHPARAPPIS